MKPLRLAAASVAALFLLLVSSFMAAGIHEWGHTYISMGRVIDASGDPAQLKTVTMRLTNTQDESGNPAQFTTRTDCAGFFYTASADPQNPQFVHIHQHRLSSRNDVILQVEGENFTRGLDPDLQRTSWQVRLATDVEPDPQCDAPEAPDFSSQFIVYGTRRTFQGDDILEDRSCNRGGCTEITVTLTSGGETYTNETTVNMYGDYVAIFHNASLPEPPGVRVEASGSEEVWTKQLTAQDMPFRSAHVDANDDEPVFGAGVVRGLLIFLGIVVAIVIIVAAVSYGRKLSESRKVAGSTTRKRSR